MDLKFDNVQELYELLSPALETKKIQLRRNDYLNISKKDIWDYLKDNKWNDISKLTIREMVNDILNIDNELLNSYTSYR